MHLKDNRCCTITITNHYIYLMYVKKGFSNLYQLQIIAQESTVSYNYAYPVCILIAIVVALITKQTDLSSDMLNLRRQQKTFFHCLNKNALSLHQQRSQYGKVLSSIYAYVSFTPCMMLQLQSNVRTLNRSNNILSFDCLLLPKTHHHKGA